jgi:hypothetical protein
MNRPKRLAPIWVRAKATGPVRRFNDYPGLNHMPAFSPRAVDALRDFLEPNGELLPFKTPLGEYSAYNLLTTVDALNVRRSKIDRLEIWQYEFHPNRLRGLTIFCIPQRRGDVYVTEEFVRRASSYGLEGMHFQRVWPMPAGKVWWRIARNEAIKHKRTGIKGARDPKAQSLIIELALSSTTARETPRDARAIKKIMDQLDAILVDPESALPAIGHVEGYDKSKPGKLRLILSCPDSNALAKTLEPFLAKLKWPHGFTVQKKRKDFRTMQDLFD